MKPCLNFKPTDEQTKLMRQSQLGNHLASSELAYDHNILFLPELGSWCLIDGNEHIESYRAGRISAKECKAHFMSHADLVVQRVMSQPTPHRVQEDW